MRNALAKAVKGLKKGDPKSEDTFIGPLIAEKEAERVESWIQEAVSKGAPSQQIVFLFRIIILAKTWQSVSGMYEHFFPIKQTFIDDRIVPSKRRAAHNSDRTQVVQLIRCAQTVAAPGGKILAGGKREGAMMDATLMEGVPRDCDLVTQEAFGPVAVMEPYDTFKEAVDRLIIRVLIYL